jgi:hypothetical protein
MTFDPENLFVSPHAVAQFRRRIARLEFAAAWEVIAGGVRQATNVLLLPDGATWRVRTRRPFPFEFRAFCVYDEEFQAFVVKTIVRGDSCVTRKRRRRGQGTEDA